MDLYIVRHGKAARDSPTGRDEDRPLKGRGRRQAEWLGKTLLEARPTPARILTSSIDRAIETARIIQSALGCPLETDQRLRTGCSAGQALGAIDERAELNLIVVGHNPQLSLLVRSLAGDSTAELRTGQCAHIELIQGRGRQVDLLRMPD